MGCERLCLCSAMFCTLTRTVYGPRNHSSARPGTCEILDPVLFIEHGIEFTLWAPQIYHRYIAFAAQRMSADICSIYLAATRFICAALEEELDTIDRPSISIAECEIRTATNWLAHAAICSLPWAHEKTSSTDVTIRNIFARSSIARDITFDGVVCIKDRPSYASSDGPPGSSGFTHSQRKNQALEKKPGRIR